MLLTGTPHRREGVQAPSEPAKWIARSRAASLCIMSAMTSARVKKVMTQPINLIFRFLQNRTRIQIWLYEQTSMRIEVRRTRPRQPATNLCVISRPAAGAHHRIRRVHEPGARRSRRSRCEDEGAQGDRKDPPQRRYDHAHARSSAKIALGSKIYPSIPIRAGVSGLHSPPDCGAESPSSIEIRRRSAHPSRIARPPRCHRNARGSHVARRRPGFARIAPPTTRGRASSGAARPANRRRLKTKATLTIV